MTDKIIKFAVANSKEFQLQIYWNFVAKILDFLLQKNIIWKSTGWIQPFCKECARRYIHDRYMNANSVLEKREMKSFLQQKFESSMCKDILKYNLFSVQKFSKDSSRIYRYQWKDNWLVKL